MQIYERRVNALCRYIKNLFDKFYKIFCIFESMGIDIVVFKSEFSKSRKQVTA